MLEIGVGEMFPAQGRITMTTGATPCIAGVKLHQGKLHVLHSSEAPTIEESFMPEGSFVIGPGVIGGGREALNRYRQELIKSGYKIIESPGDEYTFSVAVVQKQGEIVGGDKLGFPMVKPGIYYNYDYVEKWSWD